MNIYREEGNPKVRAKLSAIIWSNAYSICSTALFVRGGHRYFYNRLCLSNLLGMQYYKELSPALANPNLSSLAPSPPSQEEPTHSCFPGFSEPMSISWSNSVRMSLSVPSSPNAPHSMLMHIRPSSPSTMSMWRISSM